MKLCGEFPQKALEAMSLAISMQVLVKGAAALLAARKWQALRVSKSKLKVHWLSIGSGLNGSKSNQQSLGLHSSDSSHLFYFYLILLDIFLKKNRDAQWSHNESISCFGTWLSTTNVERSLGAPAAQKTEGNSQLWGKLSRKSFPGIRNPDRFGSVLVSSKVW